MEMDKISALHRLEFYKKKRNWNLGINSKPVKTEVIDAVDSSLSEKPGASKIHSSGEIGDNFHFEPQPTSKNDVSSRLQKLLQAQMLETELRDVQDRSSCDHGNTEETLKPSAFCVSTESWESADEQILAQSPSPDTTDEAAASDDRYNIKPRICRSLSNITMQYAERMKETIGEDEDRITIQNDESFCDFIRGAHEVPHSTEIDICVPAVWENEMSSLKLAHISSRQLASRVATHTCALRRLLRELELRKEKQRATSTTVEYENQQNESSTLFSCDSLSEYETADTSLLSFWLSQYI